MPRCLGTGGAITEVLRRDGELILEWAIPRFPDLAGGEWDWYESPAFPFADARWHLGVHPDWGGAVSVLLGRDASGPSAVAANASVGLKGSGEREEVEQEVGKGGGWWFGGLCRREELVERGLLLPGGALTVSCQMRMPGHTPDRDSSTQTENNFLCEEKQDSSTKTDSDLEAPGEVKQSSENRGWWNRLQTLNFFSRLRRRDAGDPAPKD